MPSVLIETSRDLDRIIVTEKDGKVRRFDFASFREWFIEEIGSEEDLQRRILACRSPGGFEPTPMCIGYTYKTKQKRGMQ